MRTGAQLANGQAKTTLDSYRYPGCPRFVTHGSAPDGELVGAAAVHETLLGWRHELNGAG